MSTRIDTLTKRLEDLERRFEVLTTTGETGAFPVSNDNIAGGIPTAAELTTIFGAPSTLPEGYRAWLNDNGAGTTYFLVGAVGGNWIFWTFQVAV